MSRENRWSLLVWSLWAGFFVACELPAVYKRVPWTTLSTATWRLQKKFPIAAVPMEGGLGVLKAHIVRTSGLLAGDGK